MGGALDLAPARPAGRRLAVRSSSSSRSTRSSPSRSATRTRSSSRSRTGTRSTGTSATCSQTLENIFSGGAVPDRLRPHVRVRRDRARALAPDRLPGRVLRGAPRGPLEGARARAADPPLLDQLPDADAGLDQPALARRAGHAGPPRDRDRAALHLGSGCSPSEGGWLEGQPVDGDPRARLRLRAVPDPARCSPRSTGSTSGRSRRRATSARARSSAFRRVTLPLSMPGILAGLVLIALPMFGDYYTPDLVSALAEDEHDRQPDRPAHAAGLAEGRRARA